MAYSEENRRTYLEAIARSQIEVTIKSVDKNFYGNFSRILKSKTTFTPEELVTIFNYRVEWGFASLLNSLASNGKIKWELKDGKYEIDVLDKKRK
jgi:hypothetical protein